MLVPQAIVSYCEILLPIRHCRNVNYILECLRWSLCRIKNFYSASYLDGKQNSKSSSYLTVTIIERSVNDYDHTSLS
jgi:hypothetical protein